MSNTEITEQEYKNAKQIVTDYEVQEIAKHRFCKGCLLEVHKTMICRCGGKPLTESQTYSSQELLEML